MGLRFIMAHLRTELGQPALHSDEVLWCLTVPALWSDAAKHKMRQAALRACVISKLNSDALLLLHEPEAAALHASRAGGEVCLGDVFMVVDAGGGTVDITVHRVKAVAGQNVLDEAVCRTGGLCGSTYVDARWQAHMRSVAGAEAYDAWCAAEPRDSLRMQSTWEAAKCAFDGSSASSHSIALPASLRRRMTHAAIEALRRSQSDRPAADSVQLTAAGMCALFDPVVDQVVGLACAQLHSGLAESAHRSVSKVLLVGGFAESPYLQQRLREALAQACNSAGNPAVAVIVPPCPSAAVLQGAVLFGLQPQLISSRRSRLAYGVEAQESAMFHPGRPHFGDHETCSMFASNVFSRFVTRGQRVAVNEEVRQLFSPASKLQTAAAIQVFAVDNNDAAYTDDQDMQQVGIVTLQLPAGWSLNCNLAREYRVEVTMRFGLVEICVEATDRQTGDKLETNITFASATAS